MDISDAKEGYGCCDQSRRGCRAGGGERRMTADAQELVDWSTLEFLVDDDGPWPTRWTPQFGTALPVCEGKPICTGVANHSIKYRWTHRPPLPVNCGWQSVKEFVAYEKQEGR